MIVANRLYELRKENKLTLSQLANLLNINTIPLRKWGNNISYPKSRHIFILCKIFNVTADYLIGLSNQKNKAH